MTVVCALPLSACLSTNNEAVTSKTAILHLVAEDYNVAI